MSRAEDAAYAEIDKEYPWLRSSEKRGEWNVLTSYSFKAFHLAGARALLEWAKSRQFDVINSESPVVGIWVLQSYFEEKAK